MSNKPKNQVGQREVNSEDLVNDWFEGHRWAREVEWALDAEQKWEFIKALVAAAPNDDALGSIGAGPLEDLLYGNSEEFIDRVEREAAHGTVGEGAETEDDADGQHGHALD